MDQITEARFQIEESISNALKASVMEAQVWDTISMRFPYMDTLGRLNLDFQEPIFLPVKLTKPDLEPLLILRSGAS